MIGTMKRAVVLTNAHPILESGRVILLGINDNKWAMGSPAEVAKGTKTTCECIKKHLRCAITGRDRRHHLIIENSVGRLAQTSWPVVKKSRLVGIRIAVAGVTTDY